MNWPAEAFSRHFFHCDTCEIGDVLSDDSLCPIGLQLQHQLVLVLADQHAQADWDEGRLEVPKVCIDCGKPITTLVELDRHDLVCHGPVVLRHTKEGIFGEVRK